MVILGFFIDSVQIPVSFEKYLSVIPTFLRVNDFCFLH